ncbi:hypothetical protein CHS0354_005348 [Potamilus streckersoni]|uniref:Uncharacterized protein n=1 Tax=Potamilus streckersoni TaxID=2493646 RepID=A0AAE0VVC0_9BIVA|nr:hypothetical protein CHS0354_005348 [Potamilus streckersoni]
MSSAEMSLLLWIKFEFRIKTLIFLLVVSSQGAFCWRNFALNKFAYQSSTINYKGFNWNAERAVDGNNDGSNPENSSTCSATNVSLGNHTWEVDIGFQIMVKNITVYGRTDVDQLSGFQVFVGNNSSSWRFNQPLTAQNSSNFTAVFSSINAPARFVSVARLNRTILTLCEVTVEGECSDGAYSEFCNLTCGRCNQSRPCDKDTGACLHGCDRGWKGLLCDADCEMGTYDSGCQETCGRCLNGNNSCSTVDGHCTDGCQEGWKGEKCKIECERGTYGSGCMETCGYCLHGNNSCSTIDGHCVNSCLGGWRGETCKKDCENGTYGSGCQETCGKCLNGNNSCSKLDGYCVNGCEAGWLGARCKIGCEQGTYGLGCVEICGSCLSDNNSCSSTDGRCTDGCQPGWRGVTCKIECDHGTFGHGCQDKCGNCINGSCAIKDGSCLHGCLAGWLGETCKIDKNPTSDGVNVASIGGAVGGGVVVGVLVIVTIIILKRRRRDTTDKNKQMKNIHTHNKDHEKSESYSEIGNYSSAGKASNSKTSQESPSNDNYEKLGNSAPIDVSVYSVIDISAKETNKRETIQLKAAGSSVEYAQQLLTLETELKAMEGKKKDLLIKKKKLLKKLAKSESTEL